MSQLHELVRDIVADAAPDGDPWPTLSDLGLTTIGVPEQAGGSGGTLEELSEVVEALAAHGARVPLAEHATVAWVLAAAGRDPVPLATVAHAPALSPGARVAPSAVPWASRASHILLLPLDGGAPALLATATDGVLVTPGTDVAGVPLGDVEGPAGTALPGTPDTGAVLARLALLRCAAIVGAARAAYELTRAHVRTREQFGRPLVALPAVGTALARMRVQLIQAETALATARDRAEDSRGYPSAVSGRVVCGAAATEIAQLAHQLHGAMGITMEYSLHPLTRALWALRDADLPEERWATLLGGLVLAGGEAHLWDELTSVGVTSR